MTASGTGSLHGALLFAAAFSFLGSYYVKLALLVAVLVVALVAAYRVWAEIQDVEEPDTPADLLESFEAAHAAGAIDAQEFDRVRRQLGGKRPGGRTLDRPGHAPSEEPPEGDRAEGGMGPSDPGADERGRHPA
jgi:hypothetical protein